MRNTAITGLGFAMLALAAMLLGHTGKHDLGWISHHISTFAANSPRDAWITTSMLLSAAALACLSILMSRHQLLGSGLLVHLFPIIAGAAVSGLIVLAMFEETAASLEALMRAGFIAIRQQSFHDAGLMIFFYSANGLTVLSGVACAIGRSKTGEKILGLIITCMGPLSFILMTTPWPEIIGMHGSSAGLRQRASLLCIWIPMVLLLMLAYTLSQKKHRKI